MKKAMNALLAALLCAAFLAGCGASGGSATSTAAMDAGGAPSASAQNEYTAGGGWGAEADDAARPAGEAGEAFQPAKESRKIIHNASLELESKQYEDTRAALLEAAAQAGGYVQSSSEYGSQEAGDRWAQYELRIPSGQYASFLQAAEGAGSLVRKDESTQDVTSEYVDVEARLESLQVQEQRLLDLAGQAGSLEDLLTIEEHLSEVRYQIESYTARQRTYDDQVDYSTVTVTLSEVTVYTPVAASFGSRVGEALGDSWQNFVRGCQNFVIWLIYALPALLVLAAVAALALLLLRRHSAARQQKKAPKIDVQPPQQPPQA